MKKLVLHQKNEWVCFENNNSSFISVLKMTVPTEYRSYNARHRRWEVYWSKLPDLVSIAKRYTYYVDWSSLPDEWQMYIVSGGGKQLSNNTYNVNKQYYKVLFITEDAPIEVIKGAYEALALKYHPDHNNGKGDIEKLKELLEAYKKILEIKK